jgi:hypothetical protein
LLPLLEVARRSSPEAPVAYGLDTEWVENNTVALAQLALPPCAGGAVVLVRLCALRAAAAAAGAPVAFPASLAEVLASEALMAVGVGVKNDLKLLRAQWPRVAPASVLDDEGCAAETAASNAADDDDDSDAAALVRGARGGRCLDLSQLAAQLQPSRSGAKGAHVGLSALVARGLGRSLAKDPAVRCGDWGGHLRAAQVEYAALDASAGLLVFHALIAPHAFLVSAPRPPAEPVCPPLVPGGGTAEDLVLPAAAWAAMGPAVGRAWLPGDEGAPRRRRGRGQGSEADGGVEAGSGGSGPARGSTSKVSHFVAKTRSHYDGCRMHAPSGAHLANITARRADW